MNCAIHQQTPAVAYCRTCGKALCESCKRDVHGVFYCEDCLASRVEGHPAVAGNFPGTSANLGGPNPAVAGILSGFLPFGVGVMYCGEFSRALIHGAVFFGLIWALDAIGGSFDVVFALALAFWYFYMIFDSVRVARAKQRGQAIPELFGVSGAPVAATVVAQSATASAEPGTYTPAHNIVETSNVPTGAIVLIGIGVLFLFNSILGWRFDWLHRMWPFMLLGLAAWMFWKRRSRIACQCIRCTSSYLMGPAVLGAVGLMGLLQEFVHIEGGRTWPLILIAIGVVKMLQVSGSTEGHIEPSVAASNSASAAAASQESEVPRG